MSNTASVKSFEYQQIFPLSLVIGVTGHRDLREEDREPLEKEVRNIFTDLQSRYPSTPIVILSPLAEGADRLVAKVALEKGIRLIAPMPMSRALYEEDFQTQASRDEFNKLLQQSEWWFELPLLAPEEEVRQQGPARDQQYAQVGAYVALHSQILIALWNGSQSHLTGSTSQIVQFQLQGIPEPYAPPHSPLDELESGPVYHIVTPRIKNNTLIGRPFELQQLIPDNTLFDSTYFVQESLDDYTNKQRENSHEAGKQEFERIFHRLNTFNTDGTNLAARLINEKKKSRTYLLGDIDISTMPSALQGPLNRYANLYATADSMSIYFRDLTDKMLFYLFSLFFIALICFYIYAHLGEYLVMLLGEQWGGWFRFLFLSFYFFALLVAYFLWYWRATRGDYKNKYLDYRALAEGLRVQFFWHLAGISDTVADHYLRKQKSELDWIRNGIRAANLLCNTGSVNNPPDSSPTITEAHYRLVLNEWVEGQAKYFTKSTTRDHIHLERKEKWVRVLFTTGMVLALALFLLQFFQLLLQLRTSIVPLLTSLLIVIMSLALLLAALREGYADKMAYAEQVKQYQRMSRLYRRASQHLQSFLGQGKFPEAECIIRELGEEALAENGDWVILHRTRPIKVPLGG